MQHGSCDASDVRFGSKTEVAAIANHVCSASNNRHSELEPIYPQLEASPTKD